MNLLMVVQISQKIGLKLEILSEVRLGDLWIEETNTLKITRIILNFKLYKMNSVDFVMQKLMIIYQMNKTI